MKFYYALFCKLNVEHEANFSFSSLDVLDMIFSFVYFRYEVGVGSYPGGQDLHSFENMGLKHTAAISNLALIPGEIFYDLKNYNQTILITKALVLNSSNNYNR